MAIESLAEHLLRSQSVQRMVCAILLRSNDTQAVIAKQLEMSDTTIGQLRIGKRTETKGPVLTRIMVAVLDSYRTVEDYEQTLAMYTGENGLQAWAEGYLSSERQRKPKTKPVVEPKFAWSLLTEDDDDDVGQQMPALLTEDDDD